MTNLKRKGALVAALAAAFFAAGGPAGAMDINGAWATSAEQCSNIFAKNGKTFTFTKNSDMHGGGFIIDGNEMIGKFARCTIKARKDSGTDINIIASCATDIMLSTVQFRLKELDSNSLLRQFPGMEEMEIRYHRCPSA